METFLTLCLFIFYRSDAQNNHENNGSERPHPLPPQITSPGFSILRFPLILWFLINCSQRYFVNDIHQQHLRFARIFKSCRLKFSFHSIASHVWWCYASRLCMCSVFARQKFRLGRQACKDSTDNSKDGNVIFSVYLFVFLLGLYLIGVVRKIYRQS